MQKRFGAWSSSTDPAEISATVESFITVAALIITSFGTMRGLNWAISTNQIKDYASLITAGIVGALAAWKSAQGVWFLARKVFYKVYPPVV